MKDSKRFIWTEEKVKMFTQLYTTNFSSPLIDEDIFFYSNYRGKKIDDKIKQFKTDCKTLDKKTL